MTVVQISEIKHRTGRREELSQLEQSEIGVTYDSGELFIGMPAFSKIQHRKPSQNSPGQFPYGNIKILTEFDFVHTMSDKVATYSPLYRWYGASRLDEEISFTATYSGPELPVDEDGNADDRIVTIDLDEDHAGAVILSATIDIDGTEFPIGENAMALTQNLVNGKSAVRLDLDAAGLQTVTSANVITFTAVPAQIMETWPLGEVDSMVIEYSLTTTVPVNNVYTKRTGTLHIVADNYSAAVADQGIDLNQRAGNDYLRVVFSATVREMPIPTDPNNTEKRLVLLCANIGVSQIQITYSGRRWSGVII